MELLKRLFFCSLIFALLFVPFWYGYKELKIFAVNEGAKNQIGNLDEMSKKIKEVSKNLEFLSRYINIQKQIIIEEQQALNNLQKDKESLKLLAESDRKVVEALFLEQEKRQRKYKWIEIVVAFVVGLGTSWPVTYYYSKKQKKEKNT